MTRIAVCTGFPADDRNLLSGGIDTDHLLGVAEVTFFVPDVAAARAWLTGLLGTEPVFDHPQFVAFQAGDQLIGLHPDDEKTSSGVPGQVAYWHVPDLDIAVSHFQAHGCTLFRGPITGIDGPRVCQVRDPFGNVWGLTQEAGRSSGAPVIDGNKEGR